MDNFDGKAFCGHSLARDPQLRTTTRNYDFKFNSSDHLERIINRVKMDREVRERLDSKSGNRVYPESGRVRPPYSERRVPPVSKIPQPGETSSRDTIVKVMSDDEIEAMISQAILSRPYMASGQPETGFSFREMSSRYMRTSLLVPTSSGRQVVPKFSKTTEEIILCQQPQWVEIKPAERAFAKAVDVPGSSDRNTADTVLNLANDGRVGESDALDAETHSLLAKASGDFVLRHDEAECDTPPDSPLSFGIESPLNECELAEMFRVLGHVIPDIPAAPLESSESQDESVYSDSIDEDDQEFMADDHSENEIQPPEGQEATRGQQEQPRHEKRLHEVDPTAPSNSNAGKPLNTYRSNSNPPSRRNHPTTPLDKRMQKQIETLKQDKIRIFSKMTSIQEKIIDVLDRLRISLVELSLPDGSTKVTLRERNAFEFSVRLSRNYLFPLGQMIEDLRVSPKEDFQSATTNEACVKVCGVYGLLNQALQCYHKQLRHFFTDSVPKKLDILLNMVAQTTKLCLQKNIFDPRDTLIQNLLERCDLFTELVLEFSEQRKSAKGGEHPLKSSRREQHKLPRTSSKWELTMNLNNLNMYEPKLVPRIQRKKHPKKPTPTARQSFRNKEPKRPTPKAVGRDDGDCIAAPPDDPDDTQVRLTDVNNSESVQIFNSVIEEQPDSELTRNLIEALQNITKDEVRQLLGPLFSNFDSILRNSDNPESVESALVLLNSQLLAKCEQPRVDAENSPQTNDADQKEVAKRNSNYRKEERNEAKSKEHQGNQTAARRPERLMKKHTANVKQGSTRTTKQRDMSSGRPNTRNERHSLSNTSTAVQQADKNDAKKRSFRSCSVVSDKAAKKPTPAVTASPLEAPASPPPPPTSPIPPPTPPTTTALTVSAPLNEVIPPRSRTHTPSVSKHKMTSRRVENTTTTSSGTTTTNSAPAEVGPNNKQKADKFAPERQKIEDEEGGRRSKEFRKQAATTVADVRGEDQYTKVDVPATAGKKVGAAQLMPGQVETLAYCSNVMYTFAKYSDEIPAVSPESEAVLNVGEEDIPEKECFTDSCTRLKISTKSSRNPSFKSTFESTQNVMPSPEVEEEVQKIIQERNNFIEQCQDDPLYTNPQYAQPWKVLSKISHNIANEMVERFENDLSFGEESYVRDFINMEMQT